MLLIIILKANLLKKRYEISYRRFPQFYSSLYLPWHKRDKAYNYLFKKSNYKLNI